METEWKLGAGAHIREASEKDLRALEWHGGRDLRAFYEECWQRHRDDELLYLVADFNGFPIGQAVIVWSGKPSHPDFPDVQSLRVHPAFRGLSVGSRLLHCAESRARQRGFKRLGLSVSIENLKARQLYERCGYALRGEPYLDQWSYCNAREESVTLRETVVDLVKPLVTPQMVVDFGSVG